MHIHNDGDEIFHDSKYLEWNDVIVTSYDVNNVKQGALLKHVT